MAKGPCLKARRAVMEGLINSPTFKNVRQSEALGNVLEDKLDEPTKFVLLKGALKHFKKTFENLDAQQTFNPDAAILVSIALSQGITQEEAVEILRTYSNKSSPFAKHIRESIPADEEPVFEELSRYVAFYQKPINARDILEFISLLNIFVEKGLDGLKEVQPSAGSESIIYGDREGA